MNVGDRAAAVNMNLQNIIAGLWEAASSPIFRALFSRFYKGLLANGSWRAALLKEIAPRSSERILQVHIHGSDLSADLLAKCPGARLAAVNPINQPTETIEGIQRLSFEHERIGCDGASFDKVVCCMALHPLAPLAKLALLNEMRRVLRARGTLYLADLDKALSKQETMALMGTYDRYGHDTAVSHSDGTWTSQINLAGFSNVKRLYSEAELIGRVSIFRARR